MPNRPHIWKHFPGQSIRQCMNCKKRWRNGDDFTECSKKMAQYKVPVTLYIEADSKNEAKEILKDVQQNINELFGHSPTSIDIEYHKDQIALCNEDED